MRPPGRGPDAEPSGLPRCRPLALAAALAAALTAAAPARAALCQNTSVGFVPIIDLGSGTYMDQPGGLYPGSVNTRPLSHSARARAVARVVLRDANGVPDSANGKIVLLSIGMSNCYQEFGRLQSLLPGWTGWNPSLVTVNGAVSGWTAAKIADPNINAAYWANVDSRIAASGVTAAQVQAIWLKEAEQDPNGTFFQYVEQLESNVAAIARLIRARFTNAVQMYVSSRTYGGYADGTLNPEPYAYDGGFAFQRLVAAQLGGDPGLNFDPARGAVTSPWIAWGPYLWADGLTPRSDGLVWECADFISDGVHPTAAGETKVANMLFSFLMNDVTARRWFGDCAPSDTAVFAGPLDAQDLHLISGPGGASLVWDDLRPQAGPGTRHDIASGSLRALRQSGFASAGCAAASIVEGDVLDPVADPPPGEGVWYLVRGRNGCAAGTYGEPGASRTSLDIAGICP